MVIWVGGLGVIIPLWVMYFAQSFWARREKVQLRHETGPIGGVIQLYFAGAFSFMPLTSDVVVDASKEVRGRIAAVGIIVPGIIAMALWYAYKTTGRLELLFLADAFLIHPMVQCFPLNPLEGIFIWRWRKGVWTLIFFWIMSMFMLAASEALRNVI
jgi:hypothetical protein